MSLEDVSNGIGWTQCNIPMSYELYREVSQEAIASGRSWAEVARVALAEHLANQKEARAKQKENKTSE